MPSLSLKRLLGHQEKDIKGILGRSANPRGILPIVGYTGRLRPKGMPF